jgi:hypothetical protein
MVVVPVRKTGRRCRDFVFSVFFNVKGVTRAETLYPRRPATGRGRRTHRTGPVDDTPAYAEQSYYLEENTVKKRIISLALALVMTLALAGAAFAVETPTDPNAAPEESVGYNPDPNYELLWFKTTTFDSEDPCNTFTIDLQFGDPPLTETVTLGYNLIEIFDVEGDNYLLGLHPQFLPDYDNQSTAQYIVGMLELSVWDDKNQEYVDITVKGDTAFIPTDYTLSVGSGADINYYLQCKVLLLITPIKSVTPPWTIELEPAYLYIPAGVFLTPTPMPTPNPVGE